MPKRNRVLTDRSVIKLKGKIKGTVFAHVQWLSDSEKEQFAEVAIQNYRSNYMPFHKVWLTVKNILIQAGVRRGMFGLYRSFAYEYYRAKTKGASSAELEAIAAKHINASNLDPNVVQRIITSIGETETE